MYCIHCGKEIEDTWVKCPYCGADIVNGNQILSNGEENNNKIEQDQPRTEDNTYSYSLGKQEEDNNFHPEENNGTKKEKKHILGKVLGAVLLIIVLLFIIGLFSDSDTEESDDKSEQTLEAEQQPEDFSAIDLEMLIGNSSDQLVENGFVFNQDTGRYELLDGEVYAECDQSGAANRIVITGSGDNIPSIHGIRTEMGINEAKELLNDKYESVDGAEGELTYYDISDGLSIGIQSEDDKVTELAVRRLTDDDVEDYLQQVYIFPHSDSEYLTEDQVREYDADTLRIGRNEIFARHGVTFDSEDLQSYFEGMPWYEGTISVSDFDSDSVFNEYEKANVELIKKIEDELNNVGSIEPFIGMSGTYQCGSSMEAGVIDIYVIDDSKINVAFGTQAMPGLIGGVGGGIEGSITGSNTATVDLGAGCVFTLTWTDTGIFTISRTGSSGYEEIDEVTDGMEYVNAQYYSVS